MTTLLTRARSLAGPAFDDLADTEVAATLATCERIMGRDLKVSEASFFRDGLAKRRAYLAAQAGTEAQKFSPALYGPDHTTYADEPEGYLGD